MLVIFCNLSSATTERQLLDFALSAHLRWRVFRFGQKILHCEIVELANPEGEILEKHGLVRFKDHKTALIAAKKLDGRMLGAQKVSVRIYAHRTPSDRRYQGSDLGIKRYEERRRQTLQVSAAKSNAPVLPLSEKKGPLLQSVQA